MWRISLISLILVLFSFPVHALTITWTDNSTTEEGFILERGDIVVQPDGTFMADNFIEIARPAENATRHLDDATVSGRFYCYRVAAFVTVTNAEPQESKSNFSNISCGASITITLGVQ